MSRILIAEMADEQIEINRQARNTFVVFAVVVGLLAGGHLWFEGTGGVFWLTVGATVLFVLLAAQAESLRRRLKRARDRLGVVL